jgi:hypothetical protein
MKSKGLVVQGQTQDERPVVVPLSSAVCAYFVGILTLVEGAEEFRCM